MNEPKSRLLAATLVAAALVSGCGGGGGGGGNADASSTDISTSLSALLAYMNNLIATGDENGELVDVNALTLVVDDTAEPAAF